MVDGHEKVTRDDLTYEEQTGWDLAFEQIRAALVHHLEARYDPCQDRGVDWPCDVAATLLFLPRDAED